MDHAAIDEQQIIERYLAGKLTAAAAASFEEHYVSCPECLDRLEATAALAAALKRVAGEDAAHIAVARQLGVVAWLVRLGRSRQAAALLSGALLLILVPALALWRAGELGRELRGSRAALAAAASRQAAEREAQGRDLARARQESAEMERDLAAARAPQAGVPLLVLGAERGGAAGGEPDHRLRLPARPTWVVVALPLDLPRRGLYRVVLSRRGGPEVWRATAGAAGEDSLTLAIPSRLLVPGDHLLAIDWISASGAPGASGASGASGALPPAERAVPAGRFSFRVLPPA